MPSDFIEAIAPTVLKNVCGHEAGCTFGGFSLYSCYWMQVPDCPEDHELVTCCLCDEETFTVVPFGGLDNAIRWKSIDFYAYVPLCENHLKDFEVDVVGYMKELSEWVTSQVEDDPRESITAGLLRAVAAGIDTSDNATKILDGLFGTEHSKSLAEVEQPELPTREDILSVIRLLEEEGTEVTSIILAEEGEKNE